MNLCVCVCVCVCVSVRACVRACRVCYEKRVSVDLCKHPGPSCDGGGGGGGGGIKDRKDSILISSVHNVSPLVQKTDFHEQCDSILFLSQSCACPHI